MFCNVNNVRSFQNPISFKFMMQTEVPQQNRGYSVYCRDSMYAYNMGSELMCAVGARSFSQRTVVLLR